ncbi:MAG: type II CAAX prenyl endopeptidase Rce1 family protein [Candidatus Odinarchaeota archaeon]
MEEDVKYKFYSLAKYPNLEILMDSQLASAGANQAKLLERYKKNKKAIKRQLIALKVVYGFIFVFIPFFSVWGYLEIIGGYSSSLPPPPIETLLLTNSFVFGIFFLMSVLYVLLMGLFSTSSFMSGNAFKWLHTLPLSKKDLKKLGYVTIFRNLDLALIALVIGFPTILLIMTLNFWLFLISLISSALNAVFAFSILVILSEKMAKIFSEGSGNSKKASILRIITMGGFFLLAFGTSFLLSWALNLIGDFFIVFPTNESAMLLNRILSFIPFPFGITYIIAFIANPVLIPSDLILTSMVGFALFMGLTFLLYKVAIKQVKSVTATEVTLIEKRKKKFVSKKEISVEIKTISTVKSFIRKDLISTTRDYQSFIFLIMPIIYPVILILGMTPVITEEIASIDSIIILWSVVLGVNQFIPFMLVAGFLNMEESGASILASLPLLARKQAKAKIYLMLTIQAIGLGLMGVILMILTKSLILLTLFLLTIPIAWIFLLFTFELKVRFFGKMKYKYVVEEVNKQRKVSKWIVLICSELLIYFTVIIIEFTLLSIYGIIGIIIGLIIIGIIGLCSLLYVFTRMFPKEREIVTYYTGGLLRRNVIAGAVIVMVLYFIFLNLVGIIELPFLQILLGLPLQYGLLIEVILIFLVFTLLFFVITPYGLKLPNGKESIKQYSYSIGFTRTKPLARNILIGIASFLLYALSTWLVANILGTYIFDPNVLFGYPSWVLLYYMLYAGIWEEIAFRGVILNLQLRKYSKMTSVITNGILFGIFHSINILSGFDPLYILNQVFFATCLGIALAYIYVKTESLLPCMMIHYLVNTFGQLFVNATFPNGAIASAFFIYGAGLVPMILILLFTKLIIRNKKP